MASANILKYLKRKVSGSYETPVYIGAEQRFVTALRGSKNNNLEEQSILGLECIETSHWEGTVLYERKEFHDGSRVNDYYILESKNYRAGTEIRFINNLIQIVSDTFSFDGTTFLIQNDSANFIDNNTTLSLPANLNEGLDEDLIDEEGFIKTKEEILYYKNKNDIIIEVAIKITKEKELDGVTTIKSYIENKL